MTLYAIRNLTKFDKYLNINPGYYGMKIIFESTLKCCN